MCVCFLCYLFCTSPLWRRDIPNYPLYWKGNPQLRVYMPQFWMKLLHPKRAVPDNIVNFQVHHQSVYSKHFKYVVLLCKICL